MPETIPANPHDDDELAAWCGACRRWVLLPDAQHGHTMEADYDEGDRPVGESAAITWCEVVA